MKRIIKTAAFILAGFLVANCGVTDKRSDVNKLNTCLSNGDVSWRFNFKDDGQVVDVSEYGVKGCTGTPSVDGIAFEVVSFDGSVMEIKNKVAVTKVPSVLGSVDGEKAAGDFVVKFQMGNIDVDKNTAKWGVKGDDNFVLSDVEVNKDSVAVVSV